jgi:GNAT superfamily N-acetyltransferase
MKSCYHIKLPDGTVAIADLVDYYGVGQYITRINVPEHHRKKKYGNTLLNMITKDADKEGVKLFLEISSSEIPEEVLHRWYTSNGFRKWFGMYKRNPNVRS